MKNLFLVLFLTAATIGSSFASNTPTPTADLSIISNEAVVLSVAHEMQKAFFQVAEYDKNLDALEFVTKDYVNYIQIYNAQDELTYQLPVMSKKLKISRKMFESGAYKIAFLTKNNKNIQFTNLTVN